MHYIYYNNFVNLLAMVTIMLHVLYKIFNRKVQKSYTYN